MMAAWAVAWVSIALVGCGFRPSVAVDRGLVGKRVSGNLERSQSGRRDKRE